MNYNEVKELIKIFDDSSITELDLQMDNVSIKMGKNQTQKQTAMPEIHQTTESSHSDNQPHKQIVMPEAAALTTPITIMPEEKQELDGHIIYAPIVGTFYERPDPSKPPFVKQGDKVKRGDVLCVLEAMKIMNEVTSDVDGVIAEIFVKNEEMVEYKKPLFKIV